MKKVITYGTYDLLHHGHLKLLERAKQLGDYLIVGITSDDFDKQRGKINVKQSLMERIKAVKATGLADEIIIEEYEGQKIDDIIKYGIDIFTVGSDWTGHFDYLKEYCKVVYLDRTNGISSTDLRNNFKPLKIGAIGDSDLIIKYLNEVTYVNGAEITNLYTKDEELINFCKSNNITINDSYDSLLSEVEAVYIAENPNLHYDLIKKAIINKKHVLYESPLTISNEQCEELFSLADKNQVILMEAIKTIYSQSYNRLLLLAKSGAIGEIISVDSICTSLKQLNKVGYENIEKYQNSVCAWGPVALLPIFQLLGTSYQNKNIISFYKDTNSKFDLYTKMDFEYESAVASIKIGKGVKSESELLITGTKGYIYVPAPWWKTDYFEIRSEERDDTKRYFYKLDGEGIRYELVNFVQLINENRKNHLMNRNITKEIVNVIDDYYSDNCVKKYMRIL